MIIIDCDANILPWEKEISSVRILFIQCKKTNKCLFVSGAGMGMLAFFCATSYSNIQVINGNEKGGSLESIKLITSKQLKKLTDRDVFLNNATGDYFVYNSVL